MENIFRSRCTHWRLVGVFGFALIHSLGFASALSDLDLQRNSLAIGLVGFDVCVEGGQHAFISAAFLLTGLLRNAVQSRKWVVVPGSADSALCGAGWAFQRIV